MLVPGKITLSGMRLYLFLLVFTTTVLHAYGAVPKCKIDKLSDNKDFKKFTKSRKSILIIFAIDEASLTSAANSFVCEAVEVMKGQCGVGYVNCGTDGRKLCKQMKVNPTSFVLHHYFNSQFNVEYDRAHAARSLVLFLRDPTGEAPWSDDPSASSVHHIDDTPGLVNLLKAHRTSGQVLIMFYAPWCGHCKRLKPHYSTAAAQLKGKSVLAAMDVSTEESANVRMQLNITGFPTIIYFLKGQPTYTYKGEPNTEAIVSWMQDPKPFEKKPDAVEEAEWATSETAKDVVFLNDESFDEFVLSHPSVYLMVYAPWCGHCKKMKPDYEEAATELKSKDKFGVLAALDATKSTKVATKLGVKGYPTVKYFENGVEPYQVNMRTKSSIVQFMMNPQEPPPEPVEVAWEEEESEVVHLTDETFASAVKKKKFSLIMFFAPWCGHCKRAKPEFTAAAEQLKAQNKLLFGAVDCTKHTELCSKYSVKGYPTLKVYNYGKDPVDYEGARTQMGFVDHLSDLLHGQDIHIEL